MRGACDETSKGGTTLHPAELGYVGTGSDTLTLANETETVARVVLLGGTPFEEQIVMWWNFIGRSHEDIVEAREAWQSASDRFGTVDGCDGERLPARPSQRHHRTAQEPDA